jgi:hypothetical protein
MIFQINIADRPVNIAKNFSKKVFAKMFPIVFRIKMAKKIHNIIFTTWFENLYLTRLPFINKTQDKNTFIRIEMLSKTYISVSFVSLPPQAIS